MLIHGQRRFGMSFMLVLQHLRKKTEDIDARAEVHGQKIEGLESSVNSNAVRISELASTSESQGKAIRSLLRMLNHGQRRV